MARTPKPLSRTILRLIRIALLAGVLMFGFAVWMVLRTQAPDPLAEDAASALRIGFLVVLLTTAAGLVGLRRAVERAPTFQRAGQLTIVAWALAEGLALFGGVAYLLTAQPLLYLIGTGLLLVAYLIVPIPEEPHVR